MRIGRLFQMGNAGLRSQKGRAHIHVPHQVEPLGRRIQRGCQADRAGVVDQHINAAEVRGRLLDRSLQWPLVAHIQLDRQAPAPGLLHLGRDTVYGAGQLGMRRQPSCR